MNKKLVQVALFSSKIDRQHIQILLAVLTLCMLVLGVGAPSDGGGSIRARQSSVVLLAAVLVGLLVGWGLARAQQRSYRVPDLKFVWLVFAAFALQLVIVYVPATQRLVPDWLGSSVLLATLAAFLAFVWLNRQLPGMPILMTGLILNLLVIATNGGWMPISPDTASHLRGGESIQTADLGQRFGQKDVLLLPQDTRLAPLADRFLLPAGSPYETAFSPGDILVAIGVFWLLARPSAEAEISTE